MEESYQKILELIIGKEECEKLITKIAKRYNEETYTISNFEIIMQSYFITILLMGFSKKKIDIDKYSIHFIDKPEININTTEFCKEYEEEIEKVEEYKFDLLRKLICKEGE
ncbi:MAG: hypothetical protein HFJ26_01625 [Clostridia bacterium]|nr:hypothetical protein [Clostridia bacterium]